MLCIQKLHCMYYTQKYRANDGLFMDQKLQNKSEMKGKFIAQVKALNRVLQATWKSIFTRV